MFGFVFKMFVLAIAFDKLNEIPLKCVSLKNQECKIRPAAIKTSLYLTLTIFLSINVVVVVMKLMIHMLNYLSLMLLKAWLSKSLI